MTPGYRMETAPGSGRQRSKQVQDHDRWKLVSAVLSIALLLATVPVAVWARSAGLARAQDARAAGDMPLPGQVIAQGIARLPRGDAAWTVRAIDVPGGEGTPVASFPVGFAIADGATIALLDEAGAVLGILGDGEAAFLPNGESGALASWEDDAATLYEVALVSGRDATAGETPGAIVGNPFTAPEGVAFDVEIARETLARDEQTTIPVSRSGTPVLFLVTAESVQLEAGAGQVVDLAAGQYAMLLGEVVVRGASGGPSTFVVAAIGKATAARDTAAAGTPEARAGREDRQQARQGVTPGEDTPRAERTREKRPKRVRTGGGGGGGGQTAPRGTGGTGGAPISGGLDATAPVTAPAGTPTLEPISEATPPADTTGPADGTPAPDLATPPDDAAPGDETVVPDGEAPADATVTPVPTAPAGDAVPTEETTEEEPAPTGETPPAEDTLPVEEAPIEETPPAEPVAEEEITDPAAEA